MNLLRREPEQRNRRLGHTEPDLDDPSPAPDRLDGSGGGPAESREVDDHVQLAVGELGDVGADVGEADVAGEFLGLWALTWLPPTAARQTGAMDSSPTFSDDGSETALDPNSVLSKVMAVLHSFAYDDRAVSLAELTRRTSLPKATLHRMCADLVSARLLDRASDGYRLGGHLFELGMRASVERGLVDVATPFIEDLYELTHETVHLGVREASEVMYIAKIGGHRQAAAPSRVGGRLPLHCTAIGKVLLAHAPDELVDTYLAGTLQRRTPRTVTAPGLLRQQLEQIRETGLAFEFEESAVGIVCVAAPVLDAAHGVSAALSVAGPVTRFDPRRYANPVRAASAGVQTTLARQAALRNT